MLFIGSLIAAFVLSLSLTWFIRGYALKRGIVDEPNEDRKIHHTPTPLLGGVAIVLSFWTVIGVVALATDFFPSRYIPVDFLWGMFLASLVLVLGGAFDDRFRLSPSKQIVFPLAAVAIIVASGIGISFVSNPLGEGLLRLDALQWELGTFFGRPIAFVLVADVFTVIWLLGMMYTTKFLDGLDGLVGGITAIGSFILFALSLSDKTFQPDVALVSLVLAGAILGFLVWNLHPARIFLGEGGSVWLGFMLGLLAILSGGKVATALLIVGLPALDVVWVIIRRLFLEKKSPVIGDSKHLHFRLLHAGFSHRSAVLLLWGISAAFGVLSLIFQTRGKVYLLAMLLMVMFLLAIWVTKRSKSFSDRPHS